MTAEFSGSGARVWRGVVALFIVCGSNVNAQSARRVTHERKSREVAPAKALPCFAGAFYRKAVSSFDDWAGIKGVVRLPVPRVDEARLNPKTNQPLDNFSIYMGGRAGAQEIDAGLTWEFTTNERGGRSDRRNAFRPFWRNERWHAAPASAEFYWYPGDVVEMSVEMSAPGKLRMRIRDAGVNPRRSFETEFDAREFTAGTPRQFKRVNAIDQFGNEGKPAQATAAHVTGAVWYETALLRDVNDRRRSFALTSARMTDMRCPTPDEVVVNASRTRRARGGESIDIGGAGDSR